MKIIETHCHLDYLEASPLIDILNKSKEANIEKIITISVDPTNLKKVRELASNYEEIYFTQGIHPHDVKSAKEDTLKEITLYGQEPKCVAIGEIGLDYHYDHSPRDLQRDYFSRQLDIATNLSKPVVIHTREAEDDTISILKNYSPSLKKKGVIHSFTSKKYLAEYCLSEGFYIGFNGIITFKNAEEVRDIVRLTPLSRILLETDAPFLTPVPHRGKENAPYYLPFIAKKIAEIKELPLEEVLNKTYENAIRLFGF